MESIAPGPKCKDVSHCEKRSYKFTAFRDSFPHCEIGAALLLTCLGNLPAWAEGALVVKLYPCPQGQAVVTADTLRNEFGIIPGVRLAADERTSQVVVQAPPEVQARISQRLAAAFPELQRPENAAAATGEVREIHLNRIQPDQLETSLWSTLGNRLAALPEQRAQLHGYRLATSGQGTVTIWIDFAAKQVKLDGSTAGVERGHARDPYSRCAAGPGGAECPFAAIGAGPVGERRTGSLRDSDGDWRAAAFHAAGRHAHATAAECSGRWWHDSGAGAAPSGALPPVLGLPGAAAGFGDFSKIVNPVQMDVIPGLDVLVLRGSEKDVEEMMEIVRQIEPPHPGDRARDRSLDDEEPRLHDLGDRGQKPVR